MAKINVNSPYLVHIDTTNLTRADISIWIYSGAAYTLPHTDDPTYELSATAFSGEVTFEIADLVKDYLEITFDGTYTSQVLYVDYVVTEWISNSEQTPNSNVRLEAFLGRGYFEEGANPQLDKMILMDNVDIFKSATDTLVVPVNTNKATFIRFLDSDDLEIYNKTFTTPTNTANFIDYVFDAIDVVDEFKYNVESDSGTYEESSCLEDFQKEYNLISVYDVAKVIASNATDQEVYNIKTVEECKYTPYKITMNNRYGALQDVWFFKRSDETVEMRKSEEYKKNILSGGNWSVNDRQYQKFHTNGRKSIKLNSGFLTEEYNEVMEQVLMSEYLWIDYEGQALAVNAKSKDVTYKKSINGDLMNFELEFEFAFDRINSVR